MVHIPTGQNTAAEWDCKEVGRIPQAQLVCTTGYHRQSRLGLSVLRSNPRDLLSSYAFIDSQTIHSIPRVPDGTQEILNGLTEVPG